MSHQHPARKDFHLLLMGALRLQQPSSHIEVTFHLKCLLKHQVMCIQAVPM
jgi:hypothetical protein